MAGLTDRPSAVELTGLARPLADTDVSGAAAPCGSRDWRTGGSAPPGLACKEIKDSDHPPDFRGRVLLLESQRGS